MTNYVDSRHLLRHFLAARAEMLGYATLGCALFCAAWFLLVDTLALWRFRFLPPIGGPVGVLLGWSRLLRLGYASSMMIRFVGRRLTMWQSRRLSAAF